MSLADLYTAGFAATAICEFRILNPAASDHAPALFAICFGWAFVWPIWLACLCANALDTPRRRS